MLALFSGCKPATQPKIPPKAIWYSFQDQKTELTGYKDAAGKVMVPAKFGLLTHSGVFRNIVPVMERSGEKYKNYYLLKNGKKAGLDSLYVWDATLDCESEGKIRFRDKKTDQVGFFDRNGKITIPAVYNDALPFYNGLAIVIRNAKRICWEGGESTVQNPCEHWSWKGTVSIINTKNEIVIDSVKYGNPIDYYSLKIGGRLLDTNLYANFKGTNGRIYSFIDQDKEFKWWFYKNYLADQSLNNLQATCFKELTVEQNFEKNGIRNLPKALFVKRYNAILQSKMRQIKQHLVEVNFFNEDMNNFIYTSKSFAEFYTDCGMANTQKYPGYNVVTSFYTKDKRINYQENFHFIRTDGGYKLVGVALK
jgi:hypothetical protein